MERILNIIQYNFIASQIQKSRPREVKLFAQKKKKNMSSLIQVYMVCLYLHFGLSTTECFFHAESLD